jgi:hypothetical protein
MYLVLIMDSLTSCVPLGAGILPRLVVTFSLTRLLPMPCRHVGLAGLATWV